MDDSYTLETDTQGRISVEELAALAFKILKRNLSAKRRIVSYNSGSLAAIKAFELLRLPDGREMNIHPTFEKKYAQAIQILRDSGLIMQDHTQTHSADFVELTLKGEQLEATQFLPTVEAPEKLIIELKSSVGPLDGIIEIYLKEALATFKANFLISSAFCLGVMSERCILLLSQAVETDLKDSAISDQYSKCRWVKDHAGFISNNINKLKKKRPGKDEIFRDLDTKINILASYYRLTRNEAGHPDFEPRIERPELELALKTVPKYLETILGVLKMLA